MNQVFVPLSLAELSDQIINLRVKIAFYSGQSLPKNWMSQAEQLEEIAQTVLPATPELDALFEALEIVRLDLLGLRSDLRAMDARSEYDAGFIALTRSCLALMNEEARVAAQIASIVDGDPVVGLQ